MHLIDDDVVISGVGGFFPKSLNIEELQTNLLNNEILTSTRWRYGERGVTNIIGTIPTEYFDNAYFGIHRQQSTFMDPMHRLVLERTFEALADAGVNPVEVRGRRIGCFIGSSIGENDNLFLESVVSGFGVTGHSRAMMPNRVSYWLNLKGPSVAYDSNWIGGIEVLRLAFEAIKSGQCEAVLVGTANLALNSEFQWLYNDMGLLSQDGTTRPYDADADGYARSDGVVVMYIQRASEAKRSYASIINVATRFNGQREGTLLDVDIKGMVDFMDDFYKKIPVKPEEVEYVEAYGSALKETDRKEIAALDEIYCKNRKSPLLIGTIKPNTGHSEASAALFSVVKVLIAMETETIPATLLHTKPNPEIPALINGSVEVVTENRKWNGPYAAVNAIGLDSYYGHILLKANPKKKEIVKDNIPRLILASTRTEEGIKAILETVKSKEENDAEYIKLIQDLYSKPIAGHLYRGYQVLGLEEPKQESEYYLGNKRQIWFVFSGMGSQWNGMVSDLMKLPIFAESIHRSCEILKPRGVDLLHILTSPDKTVFDTILHSFVGIAAIQIALTDILKAMGIVPDGIIGHSVGELGCAYADGCMTAEQMILSAYSRGRASIEAELITGMMAAVGLGYQQIKDKLPESIEVACHNGPDSSTLSGPKEDMEKFVKELQDQGIFARLVNVANIAYHSRYIKPAAPGLLKYLKGVLPEKVARSQKWISTSNLEENWDTDLAKFSSPEYHTNNLLSSVLFEEGLKFIPKDSILIEIAPHGLLQAILKRSVKPGCTNVPLTQRGHKSGLEFLLTALGKLYLAGLNMDVSVLYPPIEYPVGKGTPTLASLVHWEHSETWRTGLEDKMNSLFGVRDIQVTLNSEEFRDCVGHQLDDRIILPCTAYLSIIYGIITEISAGHKEIVFENLYFKRALTIPKIGSVPLHAMVQKGSGNFEVLSGNDLIVSGKLYFPGTTDKIFIDDIDVKIDENNVNLTSNDIYSEFQHRGQKYHGPFKAIKNLTLAEEGSIGVVQWQNKWTTIVEAMIQQHVLQDGERNEDIHVPKNIQKIMFSTDLLSSDQKELEITYEYYTNILSTEGLQIVGLETAPLPKEPKAISFDSVEFIPLFKTNYKKIENILNVALQLTLENFGDQFIGSIALTEVETSNPSFQENIKNVLNQYPKINYTLNTVQDAKSVTIQSTYPVLVIFNDVINADLANLITSSHAFVLVRSDKSILSYPNIIHVGEFEVDGISYSILRKAQTVKPTVITVKGDTLTIKDLSRGSVTWVNELEAAVVNARAKQGNVFLLSSLQPPEGIKNFADELFSNEKFASVKIVFSLDLKVADIKLDDPVFDNIFKRDISLSVIKNGAYGSYLAVPLKIKEDVVLNNLSASPNVIENKVIKYVGVNLFDETVVADPLKKNELGNIDYSATTSSGQSIMGLARLDKDVCKLVPDPILVWDVPNEWSLEDAATVPHAYASAYYVLFQKAKLKAGETVLVHSGCTAVGLAIIAVASAHSCKVYTTVSDDSQKAFLKKNFSCLNDQNIFNSESINFESDVLMATNGDGAEVVVNCLTGNLLQASVNCLAAYGRFIQIGKYDLEGDNSIGMSVFLKNTSFYVVGLETIFESPIEVKEELRELVKEGLEDLRIRPLVRKIVDHQNIGEILDELNKPTNIGKIIIKINESLALNKFIVEKPNKFVCDTRNSYLIYGGSAELWIDMAEWLIFRGARRIVVSSDSKSTQTHLNRRLSLLQTNFGAEIVFGSNKVHTREGAAELLSEVYTLGPIGGVFLLPSKNNAARTTEFKPVQYIDYALRTTAPKALFVNFIANGAGISNLRAEAGFISYNIQWQKDLEFVDSLSGLDDILCYRISNILIKNDKISDTNQETAQVLFKKLTLLLPPSPGEIIDEITSAPATPELIQLPTMGPREMRELSPVFIIPGLAGEKELKEMAFQLLYPTFCAVLPSTPLSIKELAVALTEKILKIWPKGAYNIIGISWGGALTIEVAKLIAEKGGSIHLYLIDSAPNTLQSALKHLGEDQSAIETNLLVKVLNISDIEVTKTLSELPNWQARLKFAFDRLEFKDDDLTALETGLNTLKVRVEDLIAYKPTGDLVTGQIHLIRPVGSSKYDNCGLVSYCKQTPQVTLVTGDHLSIVDSQVTADYINENHYLI